MLFRSRDALDTVGVLDEELGEASHQRLGDRAQNRRREGSQHVESEEGRIPELVLLDDDDGEAEEGGDDALVEQAAEGVGGGEKAAEEVERDRPARTAP